MDQEQVLLPLPKLQANPWNRKNFDDKGLAELSNSIKEKGVLEPLIVRALPDESYEIVSGGRRFIAAHMAGLTEVPCLVKKLADDDVRDMNLVCNIQREDISALEKARMLKDRMDASNLSQVQVGTKLGKTPDWVSDVLKVLEIPAEVQQNLANFNLPVRPMQAVAALPNSAYQEQIAAELQNGKIKPEHVERRAHELANAHKALLAKRAKKAAQTSSPVATDGGTMDSPPVAVGNDVISTVKSATPATSVAAAAPSTHQLLTALKDDVADHYLPSFGKVGGVMRSTLDKAWVNPKKHLLKWGIVFAVVSFLWHPVVKTINYVLMRIMHVEVNQAINRNTLPSVSAVAAAVEAPKLTPAMLTSIAAPTGLKGELVSGQKIHLTWNPVPGVFGYNVYSAYENLDYSKENNQPTKETEGIWSPTGGQHARYRVVVTAVDAQDHESVYSEPLNLDMR